MSQWHSEAAFETVIGTHLLANGYVTVNRDGFDRERAIFPETVLAFICYTMRQAIEEAFIFDVLKHYTTYATYFKLLKACDDDPNVEAAMVDDGLRQAAAVNSGDKFELVFKSLLETLFVERMDQNEDLFVQFMNVLPFQKEVTAWMASEAYRRLRGGSAAVRLERALLRRPVAVSSKRGQSSRSSNRAPRTAT